MNTDSPWGFSSSIYCKSLLYSNSMINVWITFSDNYDKKSKKYEEKSDKYDDKSEKCDEKSDECDKDDKEKSAIVDQNDQQH